MSETNPQSPPETELNLNIDTSLSLIEQIYDLIRRNDQEDKLNDYIISNESYKSINVNELLKNGDTLLCLCSNKGLVKLAKSLVEVYSADVNLCRSVNINSTGFSSITPTVTISARRQSRLVNSATSKPASQLKGDSPLSVCIKYGHDSLSEYLIEKGADICGGSDFERSPLQDAIRLNRIKLVEKIFQSIFEHDDMRSIEWVYSKRYDILRQVLMAENLETLRIILPNIIEDRRIDGEMLIHILNYLLMKSRIQERKEKVNQILEIVMETGCADFESETQFEIFNLDVFVRGFLATLKALFNNISSEDSRTATMTYRTSLFLFIIKYQKSLISFEEFYPEIDSTFDYFYSKMKETGENVLKLVEYFIYFYDTLITMRHLHLTATNVKYLLRLEHVKKVDILGDFLIQRSLIPLDLKELARLKIKDCMKTYSLYTVNNLPLLDQESKDFLYFVAE